MVVSLWFPDFCKAAILNNTVESLEPCQISMVDLFAKKGQWLKTVSYLYIKALT